MRSRQVKIILLERRWLQQKFTVVAWVPWASSSVQRQTLAKPHAGEHIAQAHWENCMLLLYRIRCNTHLSSSRRCLATQAQHRRTRPRLPLQYRWTPSATSAFHVITNPRAEQRVHVETTGTVREKRSLMDPRIRPQTCEHSTRMRRCRTHVVKLTHTVCHQMIWTNLFGFKHLARPALENMCQHNTVTVFPGSICNHTVYEWTLGRHSETQWIHSAWRAVRGVEQDLTNDIWTAAVDVCTHTFLQSVLYEEAHVTPPVEAGVRKEHVWKLNKALPGLRGGPVAQRKHQFVTSSATR